MYQQQEELQKLAALEFTGKGEAFVESKFLTPFLQCLGYETHKDYEVIRHGDDGSSFKLHYPPVEAGAIRVKHYSPDYIPTIRKKLFWIIEAKSPKTVSYPFDAAYLVQGLQYCIHPEIQAKYLVVTNGLDSAIYDAHGSVFLEKEIYEPILAFKATELVKLWPQIYELLAVEKLRSRIEDDLKTMYEKLSLSSLDKNYPATLIRKIGSAQTEHARAIEKHVRSLTNAAYEQTSADWRTAMEQSTADQIFAQMDSPLPPGSCEGQHFVFKSLAEGKLPKVILRQLTSDFDRQCIFRKEQTFAALCALWHKTDDPLFRATIREFFDRYKDADLPFINQVECVALRVTRKLVIVSMYPELRKNIAVQLQSAPELSRFVRPPTALDLTYQSEIIFHHTLFEQIKRSTQDQLEQLRDRLLKTESAIEGSFKEAYEKLSDSERQIGGPLNYRHSTKHFAFKNILIHFGIDRGDAPPVASIS